MFTTEPVASCKTKHFQRAVCGFASHNVVGQLCCFSSYHTYSYANIGCGSSSIYDRVHRFCPHVGERTCGSKRYGFCETGHTQPSCKECEAIQISNLCLDKPPAQLLSHVAHSVALVKDRVFPARKSTGTGNRTRDLPRVKRPS
jgi:hypothetical protein